MKEIGAGALFNDEMTHRYYLWRKWDLQKPMVMFIGLNPSKAGEMNNDNTITKVIKVARYNGFGGLYMFNLFSVISEKPDYILKVKDPILKNDVYLEYIYYECREVVFCWGAFKQAKERAKDMIEKIPAPLCFGQNKDGSPIHPLYQLDNSILIPYTVNK